MMGKLIKMMGQVLSKCQSYSEIIKCRYYTSRMGYFGAGARFDMPASIVVPEKIFIYENSHVSRNSQFIISRYGENGRFIMKKNSGAAQALTVVTGNHVRILGLTAKEAMKGGGYDKNEDVIVEEDVLISANVTLLSGVVVGRGATIGAGSVVRNKVPPYSIVVGNPAKVTGFSFTPEEILEHEKKLYPENERIALEVLEKNYRKYFLDRTKKIKEITKL